MNDQYRYPHDYEAGPEFRRAISQIATPFLYLDIPLDNATVNAIYNVSGDFLYVDPDPGGVLAAGGVVGVAGIAKLELNNQQNDSEAPFFVQPGFAINALFKQLKLSWPAQPGKKLRILYSTGARVVPTNTGNITGSVSVIDGGLARTLSKQAFLGNQYCSAVAAQFAHCQLWNPPGSGKNLYIERVAMSSATAQQVFIADFNAAFGTAGLAVFNKLSGGPVGVGLLKCTNNAAWQYSTVAEAGYIQAAGMYSVTFKEPILIPPARGLVCIAETLNTDLTAQYEWYEQ